MDLNGRIEKIVIRDDNEKSSRGSGKCLEITVIVPLSDPLKVDLNRLYDTVRCRITERDERKP